MTFLPAFFSPDPISDPEPVSGAFHRAVELLGKYYETSGFDWDDSHTKFRDRGENERLTRELAASGLIQFFEWGENGVWGYNYTQRGCEILNRIYLLDLVGATHNNRSYSRSDRWQSTRQGN